MKIRVSSQKTVLLAFTSFFCLLYIMDFFVPEEKIYPNPAAYIEGATPPRTEIWEMY